MLACRPTSFRHGVMIDITKLYSLIPVWMTLAFFRSQIYDEARASALIFSQICQLIGVKCGMLPQPVGLLKFMLTCWHN